MHRSDTPFIDPTNSRLTNPATFGRIKVVIKYAIIAILLLQN